ncbi:hypothetical protein F503_04612 [Ophiostoma piceae UAMH 11346]|uniref:Uncharacterized protein n=1 Tax=Ophiostoma piceae (strain UAMH 11346) TaxID=1262450 RepID=S3BUD4_OPHP1|nr:hypothetical protein F503_04612 [Ophiostoma piceae UAMH 11346]
MAKGSRSHILNSLSDAVLTHFIIARGVAVPAGTSHDALVTLSSNSADLPIVPVALTPPSVFGVLSLGHLNYFLRKKHDEAVNSNAGWTMASPPKLGRIKIEALRKFAMEEVYEKRIAGDTAALDKFGEDIADTWKQEVKLSVDGPPDLFSPFLYDDDFE